ncbi:heme ABC exporter ATP-binding protein CcmA, partial [Klebsiella pneumoniae]
WLGHKPGVNAALTADENLRFFFPASRLQQRESALAAVGLAGYEDLPLSQLSAGQQRRVALTRLWLTDAPLWILDEPFTALDATAMETLTRRLEQHARQGGCAILTTHQPLRP